MAVTSEPETFRRRAEALARPVTRTSSVAPSSGVLARLLESFFRHPVVCLLPLVIFSALGVMAVLGPDRSYESSGVANVSAQTLLSDLTELRGGEAFGFETPATVISRRINELLGTDEFATTVIAGAGLEPALLDASLTLDDVRASVAVSPAGSSLVRVSATSDVPEHALRLAESTFEAFVEWTVEGDVSESAAAEEFFSVLLDRYEEEVVEARSALEEYVAAHPSESGFRPVPEQAELDRLTTSLELAQGRYGTAVAGIQEAQLAMEQTVTDVGQRLRLVDEPQLPVAPESSLKDLGVIGAMYVALGVVLTAALVAGGALLDRSLRDPADVQRELGLPVIAVIPDSGPRAGRS